ncbi:hypothetical protein F889_00900 [Acinetobacter colistiniresistens]|uniref:Uncharacterized protein n=1 Tax=Acinetobacter colistiniresistens TaxID=280145 RepID=N9PP35_9GAMM|nr:hypothetical protein [Acinetobacter colistiniresistens]ENX35233.1 hypothetical protein F889_00900 [Acinetobacter colistiniresistens]EPG37974.1 hypothetical protein F907_01944 [Acinetobacter colistiniresistens]TVT84766.1 hypothetical protein FPV60_05400 [Acinetobacter colistiniresistens]
MSLKELSLEEINQVSGAGTFIGDSIITAVNLGNQFLNNPLISSVGVVFSAVGLGLVHQAADTTGYAASKAGIALGRALGGDVAETQNHYEKEKGEGLYTPIPTILT